MLADNGHVTIYYIIQINHSIRLCKIIQLKNAKQGCTSLYAYIQRVYNRGIRFWVTINHIMRTSLERLSITFRPKSHFDLNYFNISYRYACVHLVTGAVGNDIAVTRLPLLCSILLHNIISHAEFTVENFPLHVHLYHPPNRSVYLI